MKIEGAKIIQPLIVLLGVASLVFFLFHAVSGDPARMMLGQVDDPIALEAIRIEYGLDKPLFTQYWNYLKGLSPLGFREDLSWGLRWPDLQTSYQNKGVAVTSMLANTLPNTALLAFFSMGFAVLIGLPVGLYAALKSGTWIDRFVVLLSSTGMALPSFFSAVIIGWVFGYLLGPLTGLPMTGNLVELDDFGDFEKYNWHHIILPAFTLGIRPLGVIAQMMRSSALEVLSRDYIRTAYSKGLDESQVLRKHVLKNSLNPLITATSGWLAGLFSGAVFVESVFGWNGTGKMMVDALESRDFPVVMGCVLSLSLVFVIIQWFVELSYKWIDPRLSNN
jgi:peptide/nickel transport system permease protein